jgi:hypothetical protein
MNKQMPKYNCPICLDQGTVPYTKTINGIEYEFSTRCICKRGQYFTYEGKDCDDRKSDYRRSSIQEVGKVSEIAAKNIVALEQVYGKDAEFNFNV